MTCANCGWPLHEGALFCGNCGHRVEPPGAATVSRPASVPSSESPVPDPTDPRLPVASPQPTVRIDRLPVGLRVPGVGGRAPSTLDEDDEATVLAPRRPAWALVTPAGERVPVRQAVVIGRAPTAAGGALAVALLDPTRSVSKTHALLTPLGDAMRIQDLGSTNGTIVVEADGVEIELGDGQHVEVGAGVRLELGEYVLGLERG
ncbi:FHA domain-containing protein [Galbitalea sp. SE-J8]|uniref:FHA domain-containing protein n=1 Tax=Galbitalea sp. SE-J8 TaxID=3054952 RepID=UPI00259CEA24|nr:FHA domain-containing protein [Galbitalea sp. SE-J8]MDM4763707.1 FHA domain-containing protein [Galbitalea sp. SE-J8]